MGRSVTRDLPATDLEKWQKRKLWKISDKDLDDGETLKMGNPIYVKDIFHKYKLRQYLALKALFDNNGHSEDHHPLWFQNFPKKNSLKFQKSSVLINNLFVIIKWIRVGQKS